uniref:Uncharacterized protein n=1 Tax=Anguilla anguilla TaxID=7936 RepID=A0A0E9T945_ANGAN
MDRVGITAQKVPIQSTVTRENSYLGQQPLRLYLMVSAKK